MIGGTAAGMGNLLSGNSGRGIDLFLAGVTDTLIQGNLIGADVTGSAALGNAGQGILVSGGPTSNTIGGTTASARNIISSNGSDGVRLTGAGTTANMVLGNYIGTDGTGTQARGNLQQGVLISAGASGNFIGDANAGNVISGNSQNAVEITGSGSDNNTIAGNFIGSNASGTGAIANGLRGVWILNGPKNNTIGGLTATPGTGLGNVISGNSNQVGMVLEGTGTSNNVVLGNLIGTKFAGTAALANSAGVWIGGATNNTIGGTAAGARNVISGNTNEGVRLTNAGTTGNVVLGNYIGTDITGAAALKNGSFGVWVPNGASGNTIGGSAAGAGISSVETIATACSSPTRVPPTTWSPAILSA